MRAHPWNKVCSSERTIKAVNSALAGRLAQQQHFLGVVGLIGLEKKVAIGVASGRNLKPLRPSRNANAKRKKDWWEGFC